MTAGEEAAGVSPEHVFPDEANKDRGLVKVRLKTDSHNFEKPKSDVARRGMDVTLKRD